MPLDGTRLQIDYERFDFDVPMSGVGGVVKCMEVEATILFPTDEIFYGYGIQLNVCERNDELMTLPSLLGRDVISKWHVTYDQPNSILLAHDANFETTAENG